MGNQALDFFSSIFGTNPKKLVRAKDPDTSHESAEKVDSVRLEEMVFEVIKTFKQEGCTSDQVLGLFPQLPYSSVTARYRALLDKGLIEDTGERRPGRSGRRQRVMRAIK